jgi:hypothetical protein
MVQLQWGTSSCGALTAFRSGDPKLHRWFSCQLPSTYFPIYYSLIIVALYDTGWVTGQDHTASYLRDNGLQVTQRLASGWASKSPSLWTARQRTITFINSLYITHGPRANADTGCALCPATPTFGKLGLRLRNQLRFNSLTTVKVKITLRLVVYRQSVRLVAQTLEIHDQWYFINWTLAAMVLL